MNYAIGFASKFFTLWTVRKEENYSSFGGRSFKTGETFYFGYCQNLSMNEKAAIEKAKEITGQDCHVDTDLRGKTKDWIKNVKIELPITVFPYGKLAGKDIATSSDRWQLFRTYAEQEPRRRALARRRLIELGYLVKAPHVAWKAERRDYVRINYTTPEHAAEIAEESKKPKIGSYFNDGDKVEISLKVVEKTSYVGRYGPTYSIMFSDSNNQRFEYKGGKELNSGTYRVTIKHIENEFGDKKTRIMRPKAILPHRDF